MIDTTRHDAIKRALASATETMHAKGEVQPMIIAHAGAPSSPSLSAI